MAGKPFKDPVRQLFLAFDQLVINRGNEFAQLLWVFLESSSYAQFAPTVRVSRHRGSFDDRKRAGLALCVNRIGVHRRPMELIHR